MRWDILYNNNNNNNNNKNNNNNNNNNNNKNNNNNNNNNSNSNNKYEIYELPQGSLVTMSPQFLHLGLIGVNYMKPNTEQKFKYMI